MSIKPKLARKAHVCAYCKQLIKPGEYYLLVHEVFIQTDGDQNEVGKSHMTKRMHPYDCRERYL